MKVLMIVPDGDLIVLINQIEYDQLKASKDSQFNFDDYRKKRSTYGETEMARVIADYSEARFPISAVMRAYGLGAIDGSISDLRKLACGEIQCGYIGPASMRKLRDILEKHDTHNCPNQQ